MKAHRLSKLPHPCRYPMAGMAEVAAALEAGRGDEPFGGMNPVDTALMHLEAGEDDDRASLFWWGREEFKYIRLQ